MCVSACQAESGRSDVFSFIYNFLIVIVAVVFALLAAGFWGIWYAFAGSIPTFMGYSRFWLDTLSLPFFAASVVIYIFIVKEKCGELAIYDELTFKKYPATFWEFRVEHPWLLALGIFLAVDFIVSLPFSFATGLAIICALAAFAGFICFVVVSWSMNTKKEEEKD
jgi:hypothetical protein